MKLILLIMFFNIEVSTLSQTLTDSNYNMNDTGCTKQNHNIIKTIAIGATYSSACFLTYRYLDEPIKNFVQSIQSKAVYYSLQTVGYLGLAGSDIAIVGCTGIATLITKNPQLEKATILLAGGQILNGIITKEIKYTFQRHRPNTDDPYNTFDWRGGPKTNTSFISGHASDAFAAATAFAICFNDKKWVPVVAYSIAGIAGISRIYLNEHWTSDVLAGAAIGFLSTQAVDKLYNIASKRFLFLPAFDNGHAEASFVYTFK